MNFWHYLNSGNLKYSLAFGKLPVGIQTSSGISNSNSFGLAYSLAFKVLKNTSFEISNTSNFSTKKAKIAEYDFNIGYDILLNKNGHPFVVTPFVGYTTMSLSDKTVDQKQNFNNLNIGSHLSYEINHRFSIVATYKNFALTQQKSHLDNLKVNNGSYLIGVVYTR